VRDVLLALLGVCLSGLLWLIGVRWSLAVRASFVSTLPAEWKDKIPDDYPLLGALRLRHILRGVTDVARPVAASLALFAVLEVFDVLLGLQLGLCVVIAAYWAGDYISSRTAEQEEYQLAHNLERPPGKRALAWGYRAAVFMTCLGVVLLGFCLAQLAAALIS
jgi:hypothetical protein